MNEEWRAIAGYEGLYSVSSLGRVRRDGANQGTRPGKILTMSLAKRAATRAEHPELGMYRRVHLSADGGRRRRVCYVHALVAVAFIGPRPPGMVTNHINGIRDDNRPENLEWITPSENTGHAYRIGRLMGRRVHAHLTTPPES